MKYKMNKKAVEKSLVILIVIGIIILIGVVRENSNQCNFISFNQDNNFDVVTFETQECAEKKAEEVGCVGFHTHQQDGEIIFMSCESHADLNPIVGGY